LFAPGINCGTHFHFFCHSCLELIRRFSSPLLFPSFSFSASPALVHSILPAFSTPRLAADDFMDLFARAANLFLVHCHDLLFTLLLESILT